MLCEVYSIMGQLPKQPISMHFNYGEYPRKNSVTKTSLIQLCNLMLEQRLLFSLTCWRYEQKLWNSFPWNFGTNWLRRTVGQDSIKSSDNREVFQSLSPRCHQWSCQCQDPPSVCQSLSKCQKVAKTGWKMPKSCLRGEN